MQTRPGKGVPREGVWFGAACLRALSGEVVVRPMMYLALSYDHRMVDGAEAVGFLRHIKGCVEDPERLLLGV